MSDLKKSMSDSSKRKKISPKRILLRLSPRRPISAPVTPQQSPNRRSSLSYTYSPRDVFTCFWCKKKLEQTKDKVLAVKCDCQPSMFFCSKTCHRSHWIDPSVGRCTHINFDNLDEPLSWDDIDFCHFKHNLENTLHFPINTSQLLEIFAEIKPFKDDCKMEDVMICIANFNFTSSFNIAVVPLSKHKFRFLFENKPFITFGDYNRFLQIIEPFFKSPKIPSIVTQHLFIFQNEK